MRRKVGKRAAGTRVARARSRRGLLSHPWGAGRADLGAPALVNGHCHRGRDRHCRDCLGDRRQRCERVLGRVLRRNHRGWSAG
eukprot:14764367-Alexandrium_andersonii.AAC.1